MKQETVELVEVRGREPEQGSICVTGVLDELGLGSDTQIQQPPSRAFQTSGSSRPQGAGPPTNKAGRAAEAVSVTDRREAGFCSC